MRDSPAGHHDPAQYEIRIKGHLPSRWSTCFDEMTLTPHSDGTTVLAGPVIDQAALHGLLARLRDIGLPLVSVTQVDSEAQTAAASQPPHPRAASHATPRGH